MSENNDDTKRIGEELGMEAAMHVERHGEQFCAAERQRIETVNRPKIMALRAKLAVLREDEQNLQERIYKAPPEGDLRSRRRRAFLLYAITVLLTIAAFTFSLLAFDPFRLGWKAWLYCLGIAIVTPFLVDLTLGCWASPRFTKILVTVAGVVALTSLVLLAVVRGDLLMQEAASSTSAVVVSGDIPAAPETGTNFFDRTLPLLRIIMALLSIAIEVGGGIAFHEAHRCAATGEDVRGLRQELAQVRELMITHGHDKCRLEDEGANFEKEFRRDFYRSVFNGIRQGAIRKLLLTVFCVGLFAQGRAFAAERLNLVVLLDLSQSVAVKGYDRKTEFDQNVKSITGILATVPAGTQVTVLGITENSFATPFVILKAELTDDEGYFKERLAKGRTSLVQTWTARAAKLAPNCKQTDILGALMVASEVFQHSPDRGHKVLIVLSDMRQATTTINLEHPRGVSPENALHRIVSHKLVADFTGVDVFIAGVDGAGRSAEYWQNLRTFWMAYFSKSGAVVKQYSLLRDLPNLAQR